MRAWFLLCLLAAACSFEHGSVAGDAAMAPDGDDARGTCTTFSSQLDTCALAPSDMDLTLSGDNTYDTTLGTLLAGTSPVTVTHMKMMGKAGPIDVVRVHDLHLTSNAKLRATGSVPLAIVAYGTITLDMNALIDL